MLWNFFADTWRETVQTKLNTCETNRQTDGLAGTTKAKAKASPARAKGEQDKSKGKSKSKPGKGKGKNKNNGMGKHHGKKAKKGSHEMKGHDDTQDTQTGQDYAD